MKGILQQYTNWILNRLQGRQTRIQFDNYIPEPLDIDNGCNQGDPTSVILYHFYNAGLINLAKKSQAELALAFIDDVTFLAAGTNFTITHAKIHSMMMRTNGTYKWLRNHNSFFETDKLQLIDFTRKREKDQSRKGKTHPETRQPLKVANGIISPSPTHKLLRLILNQELRFKPHMAHAIAKGTDWTLQLRRLPKPML